jgi:hypothetical protein
MPQYLYAITSAANPLHSLVGGLKQAPVYQVTHEGLTAVVSDWSESRLRPERRHLGAHQDVLRALLEQTTPLPIRFGVISAGEKSTRRMLRSFADELSGQLEKVQGCVEMGLRVQWSVPNIFDYFIAEHPELGELRDEIRAMEAAGHVQHQSRIELGRTFERILEQERERIDRQVCSVLDRAAKEIHRGNARAENDILNLACLVERGQEQDFVTRVIEAASGFDANVSFDYNGPWAPHNFVSLDLNFEEP